MKKDNYINISILHNIFKIKVKYLLILGDSIHNFILDLLRKCVKILRGSVNKLIIAIIKRHKMYIL